MKEADSIVLFALLVGMFAGFCAGFVGGCDYTQCRQAEITAFENQEGAE